MIRNVIVIILTTLALLGCTRSTQDHHAATDQSAGDASSEFPATDAAGEKQSDCFSIGNTTLTVTPDLSAIGEIQDFKDFAYLNQPERRITPEMFQAYLQGGTALAPSDATLNSWHFAPWCSVSFSSRDRRWSAQLYLGGLAFLTDDAGATGAFLYSGIETVDILTP